MCLHFKNERTLKRIRSLSTCMLLLISSYLMDIRENGQSRLFLDMLQDLQACFQARSTKASEIIKCHDENHRPDPSSCLVLPIHVLPICLVKARFKDDGDLQLFTHALETILLNVCETFLTILCIIIIMIRLQVPLSNVHHDLI
jgi:hypothetical protein